jgi:hypothetical protein
MRFAISTFSLVLFLTGCGGGGGAVAPVVPPMVVPVSSCVVKPAIGSDKYRSAIVDMRFEQPNDFTADGKPVNSYEAVASVINKIDCVGFDTVVFQTNIPIDIATGKLELYDSRPGAFNPDKNIPKDLWRLVEYAKNKGLKVFVKAIPVNHTNDVVICPGCTGTEFALPSTFSTANFFNTLFSYETTLAREAEKYKVDGFYVGVMNLGLDTAQYDADWDRVIAQVKSVYKGKLIYEACDRCTAKVWSKVDIVAVHTGGFMTNATATNIAGIFNDILIFNFVIDIQRIATLYQKPILLDTINVSATGKKEDLGGVLSGAIPYTSLQPNYELQGIKIAAVFELLGARLTDRVVGLQWAEYMPWSQATWIQNPTNTNSWAWHHVQFYGFDLLNNESAQKKLSEYFSKPWGYRTVN